MTYKPFKDLIEGEEFTDSFTYPKQTKRWKVTVPPKFTGRQAPPLGDVWCLTAKCLITGEEKLFNSIENQRVVVPNQGE